MEQLSFSAAMIKYFGKKEGQSNSEFLHELKALTDEDREYFKQLLNETGQFKIT